MQTALLNCTIITNGRFIKNKAVIVDGKYIRHLINDSEVPDNCEQIDLHGAFVAPGLIDLQVMGAGGEFLGALPTANTLHIMEKELLKQGTTGFLATLATTSPEITEKTIEAATHYRNKVIGSFLGLHLEGPYINIKSKGAHVERYISEATLEDSKQLLEKAKGEIKMITIAPELQEQEVIDYFLSNSVVLSLGHSGASFEEASGFFAGKRKAVTHLFNAMAGMHHREPGIIPAVFLEKPYTSIIADGIHVDYTMVRLAKSILGEYLYLITDAATETKHGFYQHKFKGDRYVAVYDGDEVLSGSSLTMLKAVQNCVEYASIPLPEAINMASLYPARVIGLDNKLGLVQSGYEANLLAFDCDFNVVKVFFNGSEVN